MTEMSPSEITNRLHIQTELFRPSLQYPSHSYAEILSKTAERYPENEAVIFSSPIRPVKDTDPRQSGNVKAVNLSYRELDALINAFANALLDLGIQKGDRVCLLMTNRPEFVVSWFALAHIGTASMSGATMVLMERFEPERCLQLIQDQRITLLYSVPQVLALLSDWPQLHKYVTCLQFGILNVARHPFHQRWHIAFRSEPVSL